MAHTAETIERFVDAWGRMGVIWGIPRTTARIQALLLAADEPLSLDEIASRLSISKGGASGRLKDLREWGVVERGAVVGDRRDFYVASDDVWKSFLSMVRARKRLEFDPASEDVRGSLRELSALPGRGEDARLDQMVEILDTLDGLGERLLMAGPATRTLLRFLAGGKKGD